VLISLFSVTAAKAERVATESERLAIIESAEHSPKLPEGADVHEISVSELGPWASAGISPVINGKPADPETAVFVENRNLEWRLAELVLPGGCVSRGLGMPSAVAQDLNLGICPRRQHHKPPPVRLKIRGHRPTVQPRAIFPTPTAGPYAIGLNVWHNWGHARTYAEGTTFYDTCRPDCASGYGKTSGRVILSAIHGCHGKRRYGKLRIVYFGASRFDVRLTLDCRGEVVHLHIGA
jgi:hypothetical protein